ncbi:pentatricopeptide repeat (PPR) superfamily protein [Tasmannia lanceolata]|uniref:pentatricopeptide repeat (PPR) superfamily protein n=1 Tax=Tasmannia lanceolata TaxID=3420 RepID=UPI0040633CE6
MRMVSLLFHLPKAQTPHFLPIWRSHFQWRSFNPSIQHLPESFELDKTMESIHLISLDPCYTFLRLCNNMGSLKKIHTQLIVHGLTENLLCETKLVSLYGFYGDVERARLVFDRIRNPDLYSWKVMVRWYFLNDFYSEIIRFYRYMKQCLREQDNVVFSIVLKACTELTDLDEGTKIHCEIVKVGNPDSFVLTGLLDMYAKCGMIKLSRGVFDEMSERNVVAWTSMIAGYVQNDCPEEGLILFNQMRWVSIEPNEFTMGSLLTACSKLAALHQGKWVHGYMIKNNVDLNSSVTTALLDMYVKCGTVTDARSVFDGQSTIDLVSWTAMIVGYTQRSYPNEALKLFIDKKWVAIVPNSVTIASVISACAQSGNLSLGKSIHMLGMKLGLDDALVRNALIDMYSKCRMIEDASYIFERALNKDVISWNAMIGGYSQNGFAYKALLLFREMRSGPSFPDAVTVVSVLSACACLGCLQFGSSFHSYCVKNGFLSNVYVGTALLNLYAKCGDAESARLIFDRIHEKNTVTWSAMVGGYGMQGDTSGSLAIFTEMLKENMEPNDVMFTSILSACSHTGMVREGWKYFDAMARQFHIVPSMKHYVSMVDLLARAGRLEDALEFIERIPVEVDISVWGAFLHGCRVHSKLELGEVAVRRMLELQPDSAGYYVLMSNLYASDGRWDEATKVRELMKERGLSKSPGCSFVEMDNRLHSFSLKEMALS